MHHELWTHGWPCIWRAYRVEVALIWRLDGLLLLTVPSDSDLASLTDAESWSQSFGEAPSVARKGAGGTLILRLVWRLWDSSDGTAERNSLLVENGILVCRTIPDTASR